VCAVVHRLPHSSQVYLLTKKKFDAGGALRIFIVKFEREHDCLVKSVHADNAAEFTGDDFNSFLREQGIKFTSSAPYSPESNGPAENFNKVLFARVRFLLDHSGMDKVMWGEAAHHAVQLLNITPSRSLCNIIPHEAVYRVVPGVIKLHVFCCVAFATLPHPKKHDDKAVRSTNLGPLGYGKYLMLLPGPDYKIFVTTSVKFDEQVFDFAVDAVKEVTGIRSITGSDDIIRDDMRLLANDDEDEHAEVSKYAPPVDAQTRTITLTISKARRWRKWRTLDATRYATVHRHRHEILPHTQLILHTRRLSLRL
jgi:hypothetical protein